jgi:hypothetical protein
MAHLYAEVVLTTIDLIVRADRTIAVQRHILRSKKAGDDCAEQVVLGLTQEASLCLVIVPLGRLVGDLDEWSEHKCRQRAIVG